MSWQAVEWALRQTGSRSSGKRSSRKLVLIVLAHHYNEREKVTRPGLDCLERETQLDRKTLKEAIKELKSLGLIIRQEQRGPHGESRYAFKSRFYRFLPCPDCSMIFGSWKPKDSSRGNG